jgi:hypothetical protein
MKLKMERGMLLEISVRVGVLLSSRSLNKQANGVIHLMCLEADMLGGD